MNRQTSVLLLGWALSLPAFSPPASAESLPLGVRSCTAESDPGRRLACFDREVARFPETAQVGPARDTATAAATANNAVGKAAATAEAAAPGLTAANNPMSSAAPAAAQPSAQKAPRRLTAHIVSVEGSQDDKVVHLDNGQVWEQVQEATAEMNLKAGDTVTIEKGMLGGYWLGGRSQGIMKVRQKN